MKTLTLNVPASKPRNPFAAAARGRRAGAHGASHGAMRRQARQSLQTELRSLADRSP